MKDIKLFAKISAWISLFAVVFGGLIFASLWYVLPAKVILAGLIGIYVAIFGVILCGMLILDTMIERHEHGRKVRTFVVENIPGTNGYRIRREQNVYNR